VARILGGEERVETRAFSELQSHYLFADKFGRPAKGNDKGKVEGLVGYARRNFMVPIPHFNSWDELNAHLEAECRKRRQRRLRGHSETIGERFERDRAAMLPLPVSPYEACEKISARVLRLMETFTIAEVTHAVVDALHLGTISFDAVKHLLLCRIEQRPPRLDMQNYPHLPLARVRTTQASDYMSLLAEVGA
jgi:hypothetical protein